MMVRDASRLLVDLQLRHHESSAQIRQLDNAGVSAARITTLYPVDLQAWAASLELWLADVPPAALENVYLPVPIAARDWGRLERQEAWLNYRRSATFDRHLVIAKKLFPDYKFAKDMFLQDMHTALWYLQNWAGSAEVCDDEQSMAALTKYAQRWSEHLLDPAASGRSRLRMLTEEPGDDALGFSA